jgi:hypothetical protein
VAGLAGQPRGGAQVRRGGMVTVQVDQGRGGQQGQPGAHHQQAAVLSQGRFGVEQPSDVAEVAAHPVQQDGGWGAGIRHASCTDGEWCSLAAIAIALGQQIISAPKAAGLNRWQVKAARPNRGVGQ